LSGAVSKPQVSKTRLCLASNLKNKEKTDQPLSPKAGFKPRRDLKPAYP
jgi:hypothetical protein